VRWSLRRRGIALWRLAVWRRVLLAGRSLTIWLLLGRISAMMSRRGTVWSRRLRWRGAVVTLLLLRRLAIALLRGRIVTLRGRGTMGSTLRSTVLLLRVWRLLITLGRCTLGVTVGRLLFYGMTRQFISRKFSPAFLRIRPDQPHQGCGFFHSRLGGY
jgi:hypothetical protein